MILAPVPANIAEAGRLIAQGSLVGLPTETVYGIAADAFNTDAVAAIYALKDRPADNPLIVHVASVADVARVAENFSDRAQLLAERFWPGPLTLVLQKRGTVPSAVTAGLETVAVRLPSHPVARAVIAASGTAVAAPSANRFMSLSPTRAEDIAPEITGGLAAIIDGGPCTVGIESTVVDVSEAEPRILRLGGLDRKALEAVVGPLPIGPKAGSGLRSPGLYPRHYAPHAKLRIVNRVADDAAGLVLYGLPGGLRIAMPRDAAGYARELFRALHELDTYGVDVIEVEAPPADWEAVWDRLRRAATP